MPSSSGISFNGLVSGLDTGGIIDKLIAIESRPITLLMKQRAQIQQKADAYKNINTKLSALEKAAFELTKISTLTSKTATVSNTSKLGVSVNPTANLDSFSVDIVSLATATVARTKNDSGYANSIGNIGKTITGEYIFGATETHNSGEIATSANGGKKIATLNTENRFKTAITSGTIYVNGKEITIDVNNDTIGDVLNKIRTTAGTNITKIAYDDNGAEESGLKGRIKIESNDPIVLSSGTSNFLSVMNLLNSPSGSTRTSTDPISVAHANLKLNDPKNNFAQSITGNGHIKINGMILYYDISTDTLNDVINRLNSLNAGVTASYDAQKDQVVLTSKTLGANGINIDLSGDTGNLAKALGLAISTGDTTAQTLGSNAHYKINGVDYFDTTNTIVNPAGKQGVTLNLLGTTTETVNVEIKYDYGPAVNALKDFIDKYNSLAEYLDEVTKYDKVTKQAGILLGDGLVMTLKNDILSRIMGYVTNIKYGNSSMGSLSEVGVSSGAVGSPPGTTKKLELDMAKLQDAIKANPERVAQIFGAIENTTTDALGNKVYASYTDKGIFTRVKEYLYSLGSSTGVFSEMDKSSKKKIQAIDKRVDELNRRLDTKKQMLEAQFQAMEKALAKLQDQQNALAGILAMSGLSVSGNKK